MNSRLERAFFLALKWIPFTGLMLIVLAACRPAPEPAPIPVSAVQPAEADSLRPAAQEPARLLLLGQGSGWQPFFMTPTDVTTGRPADGAMPIEAGTEMNYAFSPDGELLAIASKYRGCAGMCLRVWQAADLAPVAEILLTETKSSDAWVSHLVFDAKGSRIALAYSDRTSRKIALVDLARPAEVSREVELAVEPRLAAFSADGQALMLVGNAGDRQQPSPEEIHAQPQAVLLDGQSLDVLWQQDLTGLKDGYYGTGDHSSPEESFSYHAGMAADPARGRVYIAHADEDRLTTVDFAARAITSVEIREPQALVDRLVNFLLSLGVRPVQAKAGNTFYRNALLAPDGQTLYVVGEQLTLAAEKEFEWEYLYTPLGFEVWEIESGTRRLHLDSEVVEVRQGPDGLILLTGYAGSQPPYTELFDPASGQIVARLARTYAYPTLATNGQPVLVSAHTDEQGQNFLSILDAQGQPEVSWTEESGYFFWPERR